MQIGGFAPEPSSLWALRKFRSKSRFRKRVRHLRRLFTNGIISQVWNTIPTFERGNSMSNGSVRAMAWGLKSRTAKFLLVAILAALLNPVGSTVAPLFLEAARAGQGNFPGPTIGDFSGTLSGTSVTLQTSQWGAGNGPDRLVSTCYF